MAAIASTVIIESDLIFYCMLSNRLSPFAVVVVGGGQDRRGGSVGCRNPNSISASHFSFMTIMVTLSSHHRKCASCNFLCPMSFFILHTLSTSRTSMKAHPTVDHEFTKCSMLAIVGMQFDRA